MTYSSKSAFCQEHLRDVQLNTAAKDRRNFQKTVALFESDSPGEHNAALERFWAARRAALQALLDWLMEHPYPADITMEVAASISAMHQIVALLCGGEAGR